MCALLNLIVSRLVPVRVRAHLAADSAAPVIQSHSVAVGARVCKLYTDWSCTHIGHTRGTLTTVTHKRLHAYFRRASLVHIHIKKRALQLYRYFLTGVAVSYSKLSLSSCWLLNGWVVTFAPISFTLSGCFYISRKWLEIRGVVHLPKPASPADEPYPPEPWPRQSF